MGSDKIASTITINDGKIINNTALKDGGGININQSGTGTSIAYIKKGTISNSAPLNPNVVAYDGAQIIDQR